MKPPFQLTREGKRFLVAVALIAFASLNTGNNLIYLIFSLMLSLLVVSFLAALLNLGWLHGTFQVKGPAYAASPFKVDVEMVNGGLLPAYSVTLELPGEISGRCYFPLLRRGMNRASFEGIAIGERGRYMFKDFGLRTGFPFIFLKVRKPFPCTKELIVYPEILDVRSLASDLSTGRAEQEVMRRGEDGDVLFFREYAYGDESRNIDWKVTAKSQKTMVREFSDRDQLLATVILGSGRISEKQMFEKAVSLSASLCSEFIEQGFFVRLVCCRKVIPFGKGSAHGYKILDILADVRQDDQGAGQLTEGLGGVSVMVVSSGESGFSHLLPSCSRVIDARDFLHP
ncbi:MAG: DUF58 domain-containing protein [bacterium]